ncbi:MAG TPA: hypothetical protein VGY31_05355 [Terriglobia bacterium]|nr:hypothetical protein [Terriglobia bacterium]
MAWALAIVALLVVGYVFRRILRLDEPEPRAHGRIPLSPNAEKIYRPISLELETQIILLGISLNEALGQRQAGNEENAWRLARLALCQWDRLAEKVTVMLKSIADHFPQTRSLVSIRDLTAHEFKSNAMIESMRMGAMLHEVIFRSKSRYQFQVRVIRRAVDTLTQEFNSAIRAAERAPEGAEDLWDKIDPSFHDFDLVVKESLLAFRAFLLAVPAWLLPEIAAELTEVISHSVRSKSVVTSTRS